MTPIFILLAGTALSAFSLGVGIGWRASRNRVRKRQSLRRETMFAIAPALELTPEQAVRLGEGL